MKQNLCSNRMVGTVASEREGRKGFSPFPHFFKILKKFREKVALTHFQVAVRSLKNWGSVMLVTPPPPPFELKILVLRRVHSNMQDMEDIRTKTV